MMIMKNNYETPAIEVIEIEIEDAVLETSVVTDVVSSGVRF